MNKKLFLGMFAAAGMLLATSCSNDELDVVQSGNEAQVTFSLAAKGGIATRAAISDGTKADKLVWAVYNEAGTLLNVFKDATTGDYVGQSTERNVPDMTKTAKEVTVNLAKGQKYHVLFWAQDADCDAYDTDDLRNVEVKYPTTAKNNDEFRDAFFACYTIEEVTGSRTYEVTLNRPFAQINVGVTAEDWAAAVASGITVKQSKVVIKNAATHIDLLDGSVSGTQEVTYDLADIISNEDLKVDLNGDNDFEDANEVYEWLSMSYILAADESTGGASKTNLESLEFTFDPEDKDAKDIIFKDGLNNVHVQRNWRTNIIGQILTGTIKFEVKIDQEFLGDHNVNILGAPVTVTSREELDALLSSPVVGTICLSNLTYGSGNAGDDNAMDFVGSDVTVEGIGKTKAGDENDYAANAKMGSQVTYNNVQLESNGGGVGAVDGSQVTFNSGSVYVDSPSTSGRYIFYAAGSGTTITINDGNFSWDKNDNQKRAYIYAGEGTTVYVNGGTFGKASTRSGYTDGILGDGTVIITGGTFGFDPGKWVADGYTATKEGDNWTVAAN